jgi:nitroreductase
MELNEAVLNRRSIRAFLPEPIPRDTIERIVDIARWAPSWGNTQPWEIVVADGDKASKLAEAFEEEGGKGVEPRPDIHIPREFPAIHKRRYVELGKALFSRMGIERGDKEARRRHYLNMSRFFGAPMVVYFLIDHRLNEPYACLDIGSIGTTFCYLAWQEGLGTIYLARSMHFPDFIRQILNIEQDKKIVIGIAVGKPHPEAPASLFRSSREPVSQLLRFA